MQREVRLYLGKTGSGKTTLMRHHMQTVTRAITLDAGFGELPGRAFHSLEEMLTFLEGVARRPGGFFRTVYTPLPDEFELCFEAIREFGPVVGVLEEADRFKGPDQSPAYAELVARGRHYGVSLWAASLYPFALPSELRRQATHIYAFRQHEPRDIQWLREVMGPAADDLPNLGPHEFILWTPETGAEKFGALRI